MFNFYVRGSHCEYLLWELKHLAKSLFMNGNTRQDLEVEEARDKWQNL